MSGIAHFAKLEMMTGYAKYKKLPAAKLGVILSGLFFLLGGIYIVIGLWVDLGALLIAVTVILAALIFHNFWKETDANTKQTEQMAFNKDMLERFPSLTNKVSKQNKKPTPQNASREIEGRFVIGS